MAGAVSKTLGTLTLILGILLTLAGIGAAGYGFYDQQDNEDSGPFGLGEDPDRTDQNEMLQVGGLAGVGAGVILCILGGVLVAVGGARERRALVKAVEAA